MFEVTFIQNSTCNFPVNNCECMYHSYVIFKCTCIIDPGNTFQGMNKLTMNFQGNDALKITMSEELLHT